MSVRKPFDAKLHHRHDKRAREVAKSWLESQGYSAHDNPDEYGPDIFYGHGTEPETANVRKMECEVKAVWKGGAFPWPSIQVLGRKEKYFKQGVDLFLMADDASAFFIIKADDILASPRKEVANKYVGGGEFLFDVPLEKAQLWEITSEPEVTNESA